MTEDRILKTENTISVLQDEDIQPLLAKKIKIKRK